LAVDSNARWWLGALHNRGRLLGFEEMRLRGPVGRGSTAAGSAGLRGGPWPWAAAAGVSPLLKKLKKIKIKNKIQPIMGPGTSS
jgi:hypothetical protein